MTGCVAFFVGQTWSGGEFDMEIITIGEASRLLCIPRYKLNYAIETGKVPEPQRTIHGARRFYTSEGLEEVRQALSADKEEK